MPALKQRQPVALPLSVVAASLVALGICLSFTGVLNDGDIFWHIRAGEWMLDHHAVLHRDVFSYTKFGAPWSTHEWGAEILLALAWRFGGWGGVMLLTGLAFGGGVLIVGRAAARTLGGVAFVVLMAFTIGCATPYLVARPHVLALPLLAAWSAMLVRAREVDEAPPLIGAVLMLIWANLHGGYFFGLALAAYFALEALAQAPAPQRLAVLRRWSIFGAASTAAAFMTPHGLNGILFPFQLLRLSSLAGIPEWRPTSFAEHGAFQIALLLLIGLALWRPLRLPLWRATLLTILLFLALSHVRHQLQFAFVAPLLLARSVQEVFSASPTTKAQRWSGAVLAGMVAVMAILRLSAPVTLPESATAPRAVADRLPSELLSRRGLNAYQYGGYLIWVGGTSFVDGRADLFGDDFMARDYAIASGDPAALDEAINRWKVEWTIVPQGSPVAKLMDRRMGWRRLIWNNQTVVHVRNQR